MLTTEGGIIEEEYHVEYVADRIHTTSTVFLALSMQCARCHDHKYDPLSQRDYYQMAAFFNNVPDRIVSYSQGRMAEPLLKVPTPAQQEELRQIEVRLSAAQKQMDERRSSVDADVVAWEAQLTPEAIQNSGPPGICHHFTLDEPEGSVTDSVVSDNIGTPNGTRNRFQGVLVEHAGLMVRPSLRQVRRGLFDSHEAFTISVWVRPEGNSGGTVLSKMDDENAYRGYDIILDNGRVSSHFVHHWPDRAFKVVTEEAMSPNEWHHLAIVYDGSRRASGLHIYVDGKDQKFKVETDNTLDGTLTTEKPFHIGRRQTGVPFHGFIDDIQLYRMALSAQDVGKLAAGEASGSLKDLLAVSRDQRSEQQLSQIREYYLQFVILFPAIFGRNLQSCRGDGMRSKIRFQSR